MTHYYFQLPQVAKKTDSVQVAQLVEQSPTNPRVGCLTSGFPHYSYMLSVPGQDAEP